MASKLTSEQRHDLQQHGNKPVPVVDPETKAVYFLVSSDLFERVRGVIGDDVLDIRETYAAQSAVAAQTGWDDPEMDAYDNYDAHKRQS